MNILAIDPGPVESAFVMWRDGKAFQCYTDEPEHIPLSRCEMIDLAWVLDKAPSIRALLEEKGMM